MDEILYGLLVCLIWGVCVCKKWIKLNYWFCGKNRVLIKRVYMVDESGLN
jgi:hypothetical protein